MTAPLVVDIKRNSLDDGPGIRSVVFFKGCPLDCAWCQNPEAISPDAEIQREAERCLSCSACVEVCPEHRARPVAEAESGTCRVCGACVAICPSGARRVAGVEYATDELAELLLRDRVFYERSGGGVTLSGGEPTLKTAYVGQVAARLKQAGAAVLLETCGLFRWDSFNKHLLPHLRTIYFDLKLFDPVEHRRYTGKDNQRIKANFERLVEAGFVDLLPRVPLVPGITAGEDNLRAIAGFLEGLACKRVALLPYNPLWLGKARALGRDLSRFAGEEWMSAEAVQACEAVMRKAGLEVV